MRNGVIYFLPVPFSLVSNSASMKKIFLALECFFTSWFLIFYNVLESEHMLWMQTKNCKLQLFKN